MNNTHITMNPICLMFLAAALLTLSACTGSATGPDENGWLTKTDGATGYLGTWIEARFDPQTGTTVLSRTETLAEDRYGFVLDADGDFIERKNIGWCGTPPIVYGNFDGTWEALAEDSLAITVGYWGGTTEYTLEIVDRAADTLRVRYHYQY